MRCQIYEIVWVGIVAITVSIRNDFEQLRLIINLNVFQKNIAKVLVDRLREVRFWLQIEPLDGFYRIFFGGYPHVIICLFVRKGIEDATSKVVQ